MTYKRTGSQAPTHGTIVLKGLLIAVGIKEIKDIRGKRMYLVAPVTGSGEIWTDKVGDLK